MLLLLLSDIHSAGHRLESIANELSRADLVVVAGDITDFGNREEAAEMLRRLRIGNVPIALVSGNCDRGSVRHYLESEGCSVESRSLSLGGLRVVGVGGGVLRTGLTPYERRDEELAAAARAALETEDGGKALLFISHTPPFGTGADLRHGSHVGSKALRAVLEEYRPLLWVAGHIHEGRSISTLGDTTVVNPGPLHDGFFARAEISFTGSAPRIRAELASL